MSKPIFIIRLASHRTNDEVEAIRENVRSKPELHKEYHVLVLRDEFNDGDVKFECYNSPHTEIEFKELQEKVLKLIKTAPDERNV